SSFARSATTLPSGSVTTASTSTYSTPVLKVGACGADDGDCAANRVAPPTSVNTATLLTRACIARGYAGRGGETTRRALTSDAASCLEVRRQGAGLTSLRQGFGGPP